jgi:hypothetical protein
MANRDLLREAIADAKAVKEVAIANAKAALEEAFTPQLQSMLSEKIATLDEEEITEDELSEADKVNKEKAMEEAKEMEAEGKEATNEAEELQEEELEEDLDLEEILAELELEEDELEEYGGNIDPGAQPKGFLKKKPDYVQLEEEELEEGSDDYMEEGDNYMKEAEDGDDMEIDLENMSEDELQGFIEDVIEKMIEDGELVPGPNADESEKEEMEDTDDGMEGDADVDIEVDDIDLEEEMDSKMKKEAVHKMKKEAMDSEMKKEAVHKELKEAKAVIKHLQSELNEVNLLNSKLLYTNKIFRAKNLTENQKIKVLKAFDKAETVNEAKVIFESLNENLVNKKTKSSIKESMGFASKPAGVAPKRPLTEQVVEEDAMVSRFKKLAGIN